jgi:hypothetical protein
MNRQISSLREKIYTIIFEADTPAGKAFDPALTSFILLNTDGWCLPLLRQAVGQRQKVNLPGPFPCTGRAES